MGAAEGFDNRAQGDLHERLAGLPKEQPNVYVHPGTGRNKCDLCRKDILLGGMEYEVQYSALVIRVDRTCFWARQKELVKK